MRTIDEDAPTPVRLRGSADAITRPASKITDVEGTAWTSETTGVVALESITLPRLSIEHIVPAAIPVRAGSLVIDSQVPLFAGGVETTHTNALAYDQMLVLDRLLSSPPETSWPETSLPKRTANRVGPRLPRVELRIQRPPTLGKAILERHGSSLHTAMSILFLLGFAAAVGYLLAVV